MSGVLQVLAVAASLGAGVVAGVLFAFSSFVMHGLGRLPAPQGAAAMQAINRSAPRPSFMAALFGTALLCLGLAVAVPVAGSDGTATALVVTGAALYVLGAVGLTGVFHVPRNDALARLDPEASGTAAHWARYRRAWTAGNHVRTAAALAAAASLAAAACA